MLAGSEVNTEDDVLHLKELPDFNGRISAAESEHLLQILTVPYLRIPLLLHFFTPQHRVTLLSEPLVQETLDATLFEPGAWLPDQPRPRPTELPSASRECFATPAGLLVNELQFAPEQALSALLQLGRNAIDIDPGRFGQGAPTALLYVLRLLVRVQGLVSLMLAPTSAECGARGVKAGARASRVLPRMMQLLDEQLWESFFPALERWVNRALEQRDAPTACIVLAHLAYLCRHVRGHELNFRHVSTLLVAQSYLSNFFTWAVDAPRHGAATVDSGANGGTNGSSGTHGAELLIPQTEMLTLFQAHRHSIISWLDKNAELADEVFEAVERTLSYTGSRRRTPSDPPARQWMRLGSHGRFMPASEQRAAEASRMRTQLDASRDG